MVQPPNQRKRCKPSYPIEERNHEPGESGGESDYVSDLENDTLELLKINVELKSELSLTKELLKNSLNSLEGLMLHVENEQIIRPDANTSSSSRHNQVSACVIDGLVDVIGTLKIKVSEQDEIIKEATAAKAKPEEELTVEQLEVVKVLTRKLVDKLINGDVSEVEAIRAQLHDVSSSSPP